MVTVCDKVIECRKARLKRGFGIVEVLIAAAVLGFLYMAVLNLQTGNRDALLRIRGRDGATEVAQNIIDSLGALGLASLSDDHLELCDNEKNPPERFPSCVCETGSHTLQNFILDSIIWKGQPGAIEHDMKVRYVASVKVSQDADYMAKTTSMLLGSDSIEHVYAKRLDVKVCWYFKQSVQSITVSGVIR